MLLEVKDLTKQYAGGRGIKGLSLTVSEGEVVALLGPNGAGKTTAMKAMMGLVPMNSGTVLYKGTSVLESPHLTKGEIGMMVGDPAPYLHLTAVQYLRLHKNLYSNITEEDIVEILKITGLSDRRNSRIKTFSTGMRQRICLARILLLKPKLILLDEPFSGMDIEGRDQMVQLFRSIIEKYKAGFIISSHLIHDIEEITSKVCIITNGIYRGSRMVSDILADYSGVEKYYLDTVSKMRVVEREGEIA